MKSVTYPVGYQKCDECKLPRPGAGFKSGVVHGEYVSERCGVCWTKYEQPRHNDAAAYQLEREREDSARDIIQPWLPGGVPNPEFAHAYPRLAKEVYYTPEQLKEL